MQWNVLPLIGTVEPQFVVGVVLTRLLLVP